MAHSWDLCPKGFLGLNYHEVVTLLLSLIPSLLGLNLCLLGLNFGSFNLILKPLGFLQLFLEGCHLFLRSIQLISSLAQALSLVLGLPLCAFQGRVSTPTGMLLIGQLFLQFSIVLFSNIKGLHSC